MSISLLYLFLPILILLISGIKIVPHQEAWVIERLGKYDKTLISGLSLIIPFIDRVAYKHTLKERAVDVLEQSAITKDNVTLLLDGIIYVKVTDPVDASYGVENPYYAVTQLAQTTMRSAIGKISMDTAFEERDFLNTQIVNSINEAATNWGIQCMRYEIRDIKPPINVLKAMETQVAAERQKRADVLESEGKMQSMINIAEGRKREIVLGSEASLTEQVNRAKGEAEAIELVAKASADSIRVMAQATQVSGGEEAISLRVAEQYVDAFKQLAKTNSTMIVPLNSSDASSMVAQVMGMYKQIKGNKS